jgi:hypothetical protein
LPASAPLAQVLLGNVRPQRPFAKIIDLAGGKNSGAGTPACWGSCGFGTNTGGTRAGGRGSAAYHNARRAARHERRRGAPYAPPGRGSAVARDYDLGQGFYVFWQKYHQRICVFGDGYFPGNVAYQGKYQAGSGAGSCEREAALRVGSGPVSGAFFHYPNARQRRSVGFGSHNSPHGKALGAAKQGTQEQGKEQQYFHAKSWQMR